MLDRILLIILILVGLFLSFRTYKTKNSQTKNSQLDSIYKEIQSLKEKRQTLDTQRFLLKLQEKTIHEEYNQIIERIKISPDSSQFLITVDLIRESRRLDSL